MASCSATYPKRAAISTQYDKILATGAYDQTINFWNTYSGKIESTVKNLCSQVNSLSLSPSYNLIASAGFECIRLYSIGSSLPYPVRKFEILNEKNFTSVAFSENNQWFHAANEDKFVGIWDLHSSMQQSQRCYTVSAPVSCSCLHPNQKEIFLGDQSGCMYLWDLRARGCAQEDIKEPFFKVNDFFGSIMHIDIDPKGKYLAAVDNKGKCYVFLLKRQSDQSLSQPVLITKFSAHNKYTTKCKFSPDSLLLATSSSDNSAKLWKTIDLISGNKDSLDKMNACGDSASTTECSPDWKRVNPLKVLGHPTDNWVWDIAFSNDSKYLFTASSDKVARLWSISSQNIVREYKGHSKGITALAFYDKVK